MIAAFAITCLLFASPALSSDDLPDSVDWREKGLVTGVWKEGGCNSSWAIATAAVLEAHYAKKYHTLDLLAPQELIDCINDTDKIHGCKYGSIEPALEWMMDKKAGLMYDNDYLYLAFKGDVCRYNESANQVKITGYARVFPFTEDRLKEIIAKTGPVAVGIHRLPSFDAYKSGVYYDPECKSDEASHNHYVTVVGYGTEKDGQDYWIVKNSDGIWFGEWGYIKMARNRDNHCGIVSAGFYPFIE